MSAGEACCVVESVKAASDVYLPISGEIVAVNEALADAPEMINDSPYDDGWLMKVMPTAVQELENLMDSDAYLEEIDE